SLYKFCLTHPCTLHRHILPFLTPLFTDLRHSYALDQRPEVCILHLQGKERAPAPRLPPPPHRDRLQKLPACGTATCVRRHSPRSPQPSSQTLPRADRSVDI